MPRLKIFLYAHINHIGAFNLIAKAIASNIDTTKFQLYVLSLSKGALEVPKLEGVKVFNCRYPAKIFNLIGIVWGVFNADVVYALRSNHHKFLKRIIKVFNRPSLKSQGNLIDEHVIGSIMAAVGGLSNLTDSYNYHTKVYTSSHYVGEANFRNWGIKYEKDLILPPLIDMSNFNRTKRTRSSIEKVIFIGSDMIRKNIIEYLELSKNFPSISFIVAGKEPEANYFNDWIKNNRSENLEYHGELKPSELSDLLDTIDLQIFTSKSEGFGSVTIEAASKGIPTILYDSYGASEWLKNGKEGIIVSTKDEYKKALRELIENNERYTSLVKGCFELADRFDVKRRVLDYEKAFEMTFNEK